MQPHHNRLNAYHSPKRGVLGNQATQPPPAWRTNQRAASGSGPAADIGSKILLSRLPADVMEEEVEVRSKPPARCSPFNPGCG